MIFASAQAAQPRVHSQVNQVNAAKHLVIYLKRFLFDVRCEVSLFPRFGSFVFAAQTFVSVGQKYGESRALPQSQVFRLNGAAVQFDQIARNRST